MKYVYILQNVNGEHLYVGVTDDTAACLETHNAGHVAHKSKYRPWVLRTFIAFADGSRAFAFERYLKSGSGRAFATKHF